MKSVALFALSAALCHAAPSQSSASTKGVYFLRSDPSGASVVAIGTTGNGLLDRSNVKSISTGDNGAQAINASSNQPLGIATLLSQGAVAVGDEYLFTVNAGSDTVSMFAINPNNPTNLTLVGKPAASLGQFPNSVAYSSPHKKVCVLNGGAVNGVACYSVDSAKGLIPDGVGLRSFGFAALTPPQLGGEEGSGSNILFQPVSGSSTAGALYATFKGTSTGIGHVVVFSVDSEGNVAKTFADNQVPTIIDPFGMAAGPGNDFFVSDPAIGGGHSVTYKPGPNTVTITSQTNNTGNVFSCWATTAGSNYYNFNVGSPTIGVTAQSNGANTIDNYAKGLEGGFDGITNYQQNMLYFLNHLNSVAVYNLQTKKIVQRFEYASAADRAFWTGIAAWPANSFNQGGSCSGKSSW